MDRDFQVGFEKAAAISDTAAKAIDLAGLGVLAAPSESALAGKPWSDKKKEVAEVAGLGILGVPAAAYLGKKILRRGK